MKRGFSTLEILIAMVVLVSSFTAVLLLTSAQSLSSDAQISAEALSSARKALENQQALARKDFKLVVATSSPAGIVGVVSTTSIAVVQVDSFTKKVTATVTWKGTFNRSQNISLATLITNFNGAVGGDTCSSVLTDSSGNHANWKTPSVTNTTFGNLVPLTSGFDSTGQYPISDVDVYQKRLYVAVGTTTTPTPMGPNNPSVGTDNSAVGTVAWDTPGNVTTGSNSNAVSHSSLNSGNSTHYLKANQFGFNIPQGATILGIKVEIQKSRASGGSGSVFDKEVRIVKSNGSVGSANKGDSTTSWPSGETYVSYGSSTDTWNEQWTPTDINSTNFGAVISATGSSGGSRIAQVDHIRITVYYTKQFYILDVSNPAAPVFLGGLATNTPAITTSLNALSVATTSTAHMVYAVTNSTTGLNQLQIIDVTNPAAPFVRSTFPSTAGTGMGQGIANGIFYKDGYAYVTLTHIGSGPEFNIVDVSVPNVPVWKGGYALGTTTNSVTVKDGYAFISTNDANKELIVLNVTNPSNPTLASTYNALPDQVNFGYGRGLYTVGDIVYFGRSWTNSGSAPAFLTLDASSTPITLQNSKNLGTNLSLRHIIVRDYLAFILTGSTSVGGNLQIISATSTLPWGSGTVTLPSGATGIGGVSMDCEGNYIYAASVDSVNKGYISSITGQ